MEPGDLQKALTAATASQKQEFAANYAEKHPTDPSLRRGKKYSTEDIWGWLEAQQRRTDKNGKPAVKAAQIDMLRVVCQRLCDELAEDAAEATL